VSQCRNLQRNPQKNLEQKKIEHEMVIFGGNLNV